MLARGKKFWCRFYRTGASQCVQCPGVAEETNDKKLENIARAVLDSYEQYGFAENGFIRELVDQENNIEKDLYTIRRQSEGIYAVLLYLNYEKKEAKSICYGSRKFFVYWICC